MKTKIRKILFLVYASALLIVLGACAEKKPVESDSSATSDVEFCSSQQFSNDAGTSIDVLREEISQTTARFGVAYIGYYDRATAEDSGIYIGQWFCAVSSPLAACYPFVLEIDEEHTIGTEGYLYCIIARDYDDGIAIQTIDGKEVLYRAENGNPVLLFCNRDGDAQKADTTVIITAADGTECRWEPTLDENMDYPQLLIGDERELLSMDFTSAPFQNMGFEAEGWLDEGWSGPTATGLAYDENGTTWWIKSWDDTVSYCLTFFPGESGSYDGEVVLECFYADDYAVQAQWQGWWRIETELEQTSRLYLDLELMNGADMAAFENVGIVTESYLALVPVSGDYLLLVADDTGAVLPIFPEGVQAVELSHGVG